MRTFENRSNKHWILGHFGQKWSIYTIFDQKRVNFEFSAKKRNFNFFTFIKARLHEKNQKNLMRPFENMSNKHWILGHFGKKLSIYTIFDQKGSILNFRPKSETVTFLRLGSQGCMRKIRCADFSKIGNARTYERTSVNP